MRVLVAPRVFELRGTEAVGKSGENATMTKHGIQTATSNLNASELFAFNWLRARDVNQKNPMDVAPQ